MGPFPPASSTLPLLLQPGFYRRAARPRGDFTPAGELWRAWLLLLAGEAAASEVVWRQILTRQHAAGPFHAVTSESSLDAFIYEEFAALHALANLVTVTRDARLLLALRRIARYHVENTQLDNVSHQPWALAAFAIFPKTLSMAEQIEHDCRVFWDSKRAGGVSAIAFLLLQDAIDTLDAQAWKPPTTMIPQLAGCESK
jgi:hypothetical protein